MADTQDNFGDWEAMVSRQANALHSHIMSLPSGPFKDDPFAVVAAIEAFGKTQSLPMVFRGAKLARVRKLLGELSPVPRMIVEFGTFVGCSALAWAGILKELNNAGTKDVHVYTFELDPQMIKISRDFISLAGADHLVTVCEGPGSESLQKLVAATTIKKGQVDMVFIDHWEDFYLPDLKLCESLGLFHKGSIVVADNTDYPGAPDYVSYVKNGGSEEASAVRYESISYETADERPGSGTRPGPKIVEVSTVVDVGSA